MKKEIPFGVAMIPIIITVAVMMVTIVVLKQSPHVPLIIGTTVASIVAWRYTVTNGTTLKKQCIKAFTSHYRLSLSLF